jgi:hypothetical protein
MPTNLEMLENVKRGRDLNITVIRVADNYSTGSSSLANGSSNIKFAHTNKTSSSTDSEPTKALEKTAEKPLNQVNPFVSRKGSARFNPKISSLWAKKQYLKTGSNETGRDPLKAVSLIF